MIRAVGLAIMLMALVGCSEGSPSEEGVTEAKVISSDPVVYCGGETTQAVVDKYFADLKAAHSEQSDPLRYNAFVGTNLTVRRNDERIHYDMEGFRSVPLRLVSIDDWREIAERGAAKLESIGWRGCMMDDGKVGFEASAERGLYLRWINHDLAWKSD